MLDTASSQVGWVKPWSQNGDALGKRMRDAPKVMLPTLLLWPTRSEVDIGVMTVVIEPSHQYSNKFYCHVTAHRRGAL